MGAELVQLRSFYADPGLLLLARGADGDGAPAGCVGLRALDATTGEVRRLFVRPGRRSAGLGRRLVDRLAAEARDRGFRRLVLSTLPTMAHAGALYAGCGFAPVDPYVEEPTPGVRFYALDL